MKTQTVEAAKLQGLIEGAEIVKVDNGCFSGDALYVLICLDPRDTWNHRIMENSAYARFELGEDWKLEQFVYSKCAKFRKCKVKSLEHAAEKLNAYIKAHRERSAD